MERRAMARLVDNEAPSETESEDEPILYRDTMSDRGVITPPSGFTSPGVEPDSQHLVSLFCMQYTGAFWKSLNLVSL
jgi:hypothetical protein